MRSGRRTVVRHKPQMLRITGDRIARWRLQTVAMPIAGHANQRQIQLAPCERNITLENRYHSKTLASTNATVETQSNL